MPNPIRTIVPFLILCLVMMLTACGAPRSTVTASQAPLPYKKLIANAEVETKAGNYAAAAENYRMAYDQKSKKKNILYKAAELFTRVRDYRQAAEAYQFLETDESRWPLLGLQYGRALKQDGRYEQARRELALFLEAYNGADRPIVAEIVRNELAGIQLAREQQGTESMVDISRPGRGINTGGDEFGPVAVAGDQLYFTSTAGGQSRLYQSRLQAQEWTKANVPPGFPVIAEGEFGTGSLSADGSVFYFSICSGITGEDFTNRCEIFRGERSLNGNWSQPKRLSETVNFTGSNNAYPSVSKDVDGRTILHFASDRPGGRGGMDIYTSVQITADDPTQFSNAIPESATINTVSDEITPVYIVAEETLYFSSTGHPGFGGLDVFRARRKLGNFQAPENFGEPVNSAADDYGLSITPGGAAGYLTSNRSFKESKTSTTETDIFSLNFRAGRAKLKATIYDNTTGEELGGSEVTLLEVGEDGRAMEIGRRIFPSGVYSFDLRPGSSYRVIIRRKNYQGKEYDVKTNTTGSALYGQPVFLRRSAAGSTSQGNRPPVPISGQNQGGAPPLTTTPPAPVVTNPAPVPAPKSGNDPLAYRIQISAQKAFDPSAGKYEAIRYLGNLLGTPIPGRSLQRITVGYFTDVAAAKKALSEVQSKGFPSAFTVKYNDGKRHGQVKL